MKRSLPALLLVFSIFCASRSAHALTFYSEAGFGLTYLRNATSYFGTYVVSPTDLGYNAGAGIFLSFKDGRDALDFHLGIQARLSSASDPGGNYSILGLYPVGRIQISRLYLGGSVTPYLWHRGGTSAGFDSFLLDTSSLAYYFEMGALFPMTPKFSLGFAGTLTYVSSDAGISPRPIMDGVFFMRFYAASSAPSGEGSNEFKGWRYPFGKMR